MYILLLLLCISQIDAGVITPAPQQLIERDYFVKIGNDWNIVVDKSAETYLQIAEILRDRIYTNHNINLSIKDITEIGEEKQIIVGNPLKRDEIAKFSAARGIDIDEDFNKEGYVMDVGAKNIIIVGSAPAGLFYGCISLVQVMTDRGNGIEVQGVRVIDYPDIKMRGVHFCGVDFNEIYSQINELINLKINTVIFEGYGFYTLESNSWYSGKIWKELYTELFDYCRKYYIEPIPQLQSFGKAGEILKKDCLCVEGFYVKDEPFKFTNNIAKPINPIDINISNSGFEDGTTGWSFGSEWSIDNTIFHSGSASAKMELLSAPPWPNSSSYLTSSTLNIISNSIYSLSFWGKGQGVNMVVYKTPQVTAVLLDSSDNVIDTYSIMFPEGNSDWKKYSLPIVARSNGKKIYIYSRAQGSYGTIWLDDFELKRMNGFLKNVIRPPADTDIKVTSLDKSATYLESVDYNVIDGEFSYPYSIDNTSSTLKRVEGGGITNNEIVLVSYDYAQYVSDAIPYCSSEPRTYNIIFEGIEKVIDYLEPNYIHIGHDEIRGLNRDSRDIKRGIENYKLLADDINKLNNMIKSKDKSIKMMMWDDMVNLWHNGGDENYQVRYGGASGRTADAIDIISKDIIMNCWWYDENDWLNKMANSPDYFKSKGFKWLAVAWKDTNNINNWIEIVQQHRDNCLGIVSCTWNGWDDALNGVKYLAKKSWCASPTVVENCAYYCKDITFSIPVADKNLKFFVPAYTFNEDYEIKITEMNTNCSLIREANKKTRNISFYIKVGKAPVYDIKIYSIKTGEDISKELNKKIMIEIPYNMADYSEYPYYTEDDLRGIRLNESNVKWEKVDDGINYVDRAEKVVKFEVRSMSIYVAGVVIGEERLDKNKIVVFPNPWYKGVSGEEKIYFVNLTEGTKIYIYNEAGEEIEVIESTCGTGEWNISGIGSGLYFYKLKDKKDVVIGKIVIIK